LLSTRRSAKTTVTARALLKDLEDDFMSWILKGHFRERIFHVR